jgi:NAD(P)-dependent dehydrogenase (short-subunit alcohol dehydrogenase family)
MDLHLAGKTAVVTGASKGIGLAVTRALVEAGAHVVAGSRTRGDQLPALEETGQVSFVSVDLSQPDAAEELVAAAAHRGGIDVLVNNVGIALIRPGGFASISDDEWQASWDPPLVEIYDYSATKAAVTDLMKTLSKELAPNNIRVNSVSPGPVSTGLWTEKGRAADGFAAASGPTADEVGAMIQDNTPTGRFTTPEQVADLVVFLASDRAGNTTGSDYRIDGGFVTTL